VGWGPNRGERLGPVISVVVVTFNSSAVIGACLEALVRVLPAEAQIIVVDNASSDRTQDVVAGFDRVRLIVSSANVGFGAGCNAGVRAVRGDWVIIVNPDVVVQDFNASAFLADASDPELGLMGLIAPERTGLLSPDSMLGQYPRWWSGVVRSSWGLVQPRQLGEVMARLMREPASKGFWASGALFAARREAWNKVGGPTQCQCDAQNEHKRTKRANFQHRRSHNRRLLV